MSRQISSIDNCSGSRNPNSFLLNDQLIDPDLDLYISSNIFWGKFGKKYVGQIIGGMRESYLN